MTTEPGNEQTQTNPAPTILLAPAVQGPGGSLFIHNDYQSAVEPWEVEAHMEAHVGPIKEHQDFGDVESLVEYIQRFGMPSQTLVLWNSSLIRAVLDYHQPDGTPGRTAWTAAHQFELSEEFTRWQGFADGAATRQQQVVEFLEDNIEDVSAPSASELLMIVRTLRANVKANASAEYRPDGTTSVSFDRSTTLTTGPSAAELPPEIEITVPILQGHTEFVTDDAGDVVLDATGQARARIVKYKLRVRVRAVVGDDARLSLRFSMPTADRAYQQVVEERVQGLQGLLDGYTVLRARE